MKGWSEYVNADPVGEKAAQARPAGSASVTFEADENALYVISRLDGMAVPDLGDDAALRARLFIDARPANEVRSFGVVAPIEIFTRGSDGAGTTMGLSLGTFGNGYNMLLRPEGISSVLETDAGGDRSLTIRVPRKYLHRHEWALDSINSILGVRLEVSVADPNPEAKVRFPPANSYVTNSASFAWDEKNIHGFHETDARSLMTLRLSRQPVESWSVRLY